MSKQLQTSRPSKKPLRLVLIGKTGAGKSKTGNVILNNDTHFQCASQGSSLTQVCKSSDAIVSENWVTIVDTPGLFDTKKNNQEILDEITKCIWMTAPGPHAFLFVVRIGRFTTEDLSTLELFVKHFGENIFKFMVVIFAHYDDWKRDGVNDHSDIKDFVKTLSLKLQNIIKNKCKDRIVAFDNTLKGFESRSQVSELMSIIDVMNKSNMKDENEYYSNGDYKKAHVVIQKEVMMEKYNLERQCFREEAKMQRQIEEATDEKVKKSLAKKQDECRLKWKERLNETNIQRNVQRQPVRIIVLKNVLEIGSAGLGVLGDIIPGPVGIGFKIAATVAGIFSNIFNSIYK
ncbi:Hypothetical predicted protein [Mytilus galloprovincialis]|uniref:AIG1-type G domain-containing protein n=1 Tax=Mytilus galloprovincialis TaxID=29158 RepID=A0A8B6HUC1_MYTGA|nr:Hypothetical predicted protein [Mytilus galloprovincialis]